MTELQLYKFINENNLEYNYIEKEEIYLFIPFYLLEEFTKFLGYAFFDDSCKCWLKRGYIAIKASNICEYFDIEINNIFKDKQC